MPPRGLNNKYCPFQVTHRSVDEAYLTVLIARRIDNRRKAKNVTNGYLYAIATALEIHRKYLRYVVNILI